MLQATETRLVGIYFLFKQRGKPAPACGRAGLTSAYRGRNEVLTSGKSNEGAKPADECPQREERSSDLWEKQRGGEARGRVPTDGGTKF